MSVEVRITAPTAGIASGGFPGGRVTECECASMNRFHLVTEWHLNVPLDRVWDTLLDAPQWPTWWRGIRSVERVADGDPSGVGMRLRQRWRSLLPVTLTLDLEIVEVEPGRRLVGRASGDLAGTCTFQFEGAGDTTVVRFVMDISPTRRWMNLPVPFAGRIAELNFDAVMRQGGSGIARRLGALEERAREAQAT